MTDSTRVSIGPDSADDLGRHAHIVCRDCPYEHLTNPGAGAVLSGNHKARTGHTVDWAVIRR
jgi:hypothetical protein